MPHFIARHERQSVGLEGDDLRLQTRKDMTKKGQKITQSDIVPVSDGENSADTLVFRVNSQSKPGMTYCVDLEAYDCDCSSFTWIKYCKHIAAVQYHFPETFPSIPASTLSSASLASEIDVIKEDNFNRNHNTSISDNTITLDAVKDNLRKLVLFLDAHPSFPFPNSLLNLLPHVTAVNDDIQHVQQSMLSPSKYVAPNQHSWTETAEAMGTQVKSKKRTHTEAYSGGERSGKKAKSDALEPLSAPSCVFCY